MLVIPIIRIESCENFKIYQYNAHLLYLVKMSVNILCSIIDFDTNKKLNQKDFGKIIWHPQEQFFIYHSNSGSQSSATSSTYSLNNISHNVINFDELDRNNCLDTINPKTIFGCTPPVYHTETQKF